MGSAINGYTPLELAVQKDDIERVKILINSGENIHVTDEYGDTLLDRALFADRIEIAELLKSKGAKAPNFEEEQNQMDQYKSQKLGVPQNMGWVFIFFLIDCFFKGIILFFSVISCFCFITFHSINIR